jgi:hypothetical protein
MLCKAGRERQRGHAKYVEKMYFFHKAVIIAQLIPYTSPKP